MGAAGGNNGRAVIRGEGGRLKGAYKERRMCVC